MSTLGFIYNGVGLLRFFLVFSYGLFVWCDFFNVSFLYYTCWIFCGFLCLIARRVYLGENPLLVVFVFVLPLVSVFLSPDIQNSFYYLLKYWLWGISLVSLMTYVYFRGGERVLFEILALNILIIFLISIFLLFEYGAVRPVPGTDPALKDFAPHFSTKVSAILLIAFPLVSWYAIKHRYIAFSLVPMVVFSVFVSGSRAAILLIVVEIFFFMTILLVKDIKRLLIVIFVLLLVFIIGFDYFSGQLSLMYGKLLSSTLLGGGGVDFERTEMFLLALDLLPENWLLGLGVESFGYYSEGVIGEYRVSHNYFVTTWLEFGLFGFIAWNCLVTVMLYRSFKLGVSMDTNWLFYLIVFFTLCIAFMHWMFRPQLYNPLFYVLMSVCLINPKYFFSKDRGRCD